MRLFGRVCSAVAARGGVLMVMVATLAASSTAAAEDIVISAAKGTPHGKWVVQSDSTAMEGQKIRQPDGGAGKLSSALASPSNYFDVTFYATKGVGYRLWIRGTAFGNSWANDSVFVQFSGSVSSSGSARWRIGTTSATEVNLESCSGCNNLYGWKWQDNGWGSTTTFGPLVYFATTGTQTIRVQTREDGIAIDRILLSSSTYLNKVPPGTDMPSGSSSGSGSDSDSDSDSDPAPLPSSGSTLKVLHWNIHHGVGTDGVYNLDRIASWIAKTGANVVSLNEVEKYTGWGNEDQPARFAALLNSKTGKKWYYNFAQRDGGTNGQGNLLLSTFPMDDWNDYELSYSRSVAHATIYVNGIRVNLFSTHLDPDSSSRRLYQMKQLVGWANTFSQQRIIAGDFNAWPGASEIDYMTSGHFDAWANAIAKDCEVAYSGNTAGNTRNSRIDYIFYSRQVNRISLVRMQVYDTRDSSGDMPSDHRPIMATYEVK